MKIIDTYNDIFGVYENGVFNKALWENYALSAFPCLKGKIEKDYLSYPEYKDKITEILNDVPQKREEAEKVHQSFIKATENLSDKIKEKFNVDLDVTIVLYLGLGNAAGWATHIRDKKFVLIGLEKVVEIGWYSERDMQDLLYHELGHIYHSLFERKNYLISKRQKGIYQLYSEGIAMAFEQTLCGNENRFHQDVDGWLSWCRENEKLIKAEYLKRLKNNESVQDFFGDWRSFMGRSDVGYYLGAVFVRSLMNKYSIQQIASMKLNTVYKEFIKFAEMS